MRLDAITAELRPRNAWEATDLGAAMVRRWFGPVYGAWFAVALPLFLLLHLLCWGRWEWVPWLLWWLKPLLDRPPLYVLGHALFGDPPGRRQFHRALPGLLRRQALAALTWRRLDPARSFTLPVQQLEDLSGQARRQRLRDLGQPGRGPAIWLTVIGANLEIAMDFALIALVWLLAPDFVALEFSDLLDDTDALGQLWLNVVSFCGLSLVEPFYVAAGFGLYLNRRTWLEAWDLELGFRRLGARLAGAGRVATVLAALALGLSLLAVPPAGMAADVCQEWRDRQAELSRAASPVKQALAETLRDPELRLCEVQEHWRFHEKPEQPESISVRDDSLARWFAEVVEYLLWFAVGVFAAIAGWWLLRRAPHALARARRRAARPGIAPVGGQNAALVPPDAGLGAAAWQLWDGGQPREALRLLYRGSLAGLATRYGLPVRISATEDECLRLAAGHLANPDLVGYFRRLTQAWQATAYAHRPPDAGAARALCEEWPGYFASSQSELTA